VGDTKGIFISYRRGETAAYAGWLEDTLSQHFGQQKVFRDVDSIEPGLNFAEVIERAVDSCEVLIAVIGENWLTVVDKNDRPRLQNPHDYVRIEIATALKRNIRVIPLLVQGATMPDADELPEDLAPLAQRNAVEARDITWKDDVRRVVATLENVLDSKEEGGRWRAQVGPRLTRLTAAKSAAGPRARPKELRALAITIALVIAAMIFVELILNLF